MNSSEAKQLFHAAREAHSFRQYKKALVHLDALCAAGYENAGVAYLRARCLAHLGENDEVRRIARWLTYEFNDPRGEQILSWFKRKEKERKDAEPKSADAPASPPPGSETSEDDLATPSPAVRAAAPEPRPAVPSELEHAASAGQPMGNMLISFRDAVEPVPVLDIFEDPDSDTTAVAATEPEAPQAEEAEFAAYEPETPETDELSEASEDRAEETEDDTTVPLVAVEEDDAPAAMPVISFSDAVEVSPPAPPTEESKTSPEEEDVVPALEIFEEEAVAPANTVISFADAYEYVPPQAADTAAVTPAESPIEKAEPPPEEDLSESEPISAEVESIPEAEPAESPASLTFADSPEEPEPRFEDIHVPDSMDEIPAPDLDEFITGPAHRGRSLLRAAVAIVVLGGIAVGGYLLSERAAVAPPAPSAPTVVAEQSSNVAQTTSAVEVPESAAPAQTPAPAPFDEIRIHAVNGLVGGAGNLADVEGRAVHFEPDASGAYRVRAAGITLDDIVEGEPTSTGEHALPFPFPFGGRSWNAVYVNANGNLTFGYPEYVVWHDREPTQASTFRAMAAALDSRAAAGAEHMVAPFWGVVDVDRTTITTESSPERAAFSWSAVRPDTGQESLFSAALYPSGKIVFTYPALADRDGITGIFPGIPWGGETIALAAAPKEPKNSYIDLVSLDVQDAPSALQFVLTMSAPIPVAVRSGELVYTVQVNADSETYRFGARVGGELSLWAEGLPEPWPIGFVTDADKAYFYVSKSVFEDARNLTASASVAWESRPGLADTIESPMDIGGYSESTGEIDLTASSAAAPGNVFEVFHHPTLSDAQETWNGLPDSSAVDIAVYFTDIRFDSLEQNALSLEDDDDPSRLHIAYAGAGTYNASTRYDEHEFYGYGTGLNSVARRVLRDHIARLELPEAFADLRVADGWSPALHTPAVAEVSEMFTASPYPESSPAGGALWLEDDQRQFLRVTRPPRGPAGMASLDLAALGLLPPGETIETFLLRKLGATDDENLFRAEKILVNRASLGPSIPERTTPWRLAVYLLHESGHEPNPELVQRVRRLSAQLPWYFDAISGGRMEVVHAE